MKLTKRQKMLLAVFLLGVVGLVVDRIFLRPQGGPAAASASSPSQGSAAAPTLPSPPARVPLAERLNNLLAGRRMDANDLRDPFSLPATWSDTGAAGGEKTPDAVRGFLRKHQLKAVFMRGQEWCVQVDDNYLAPGEYLDGFRLVSVDQKSAVFEREGRQAVLGLAVK